MKTKVVNMECKNYRIICKTDLHHAASLQEFNKFTGEKIMSEHLTLKEAYKKLLDYFSEDAGRYFNNWGAAVAYNGKQGLDAGKTSLDGTRAYSCDIFLYYIEQE